MQNFFIINKKEGETPLEALESFRMKKKIDKKVPMTYAGRLDPMASGVLIILVGEECKQKEKYLKLDKEYEFTILFGFATDTYDILGKIKHVDILENVDMSEFQSKIKKNLKHFKGKFAQKYPMYSSRTVAGRPLFSYARAGEEVEAPVREANVKKLEFLGVKKISSKALLKNIETRITKINSKNDFRQKEILKLWRTCVRQDLTQSYVVAYFRARVSSGTYIRTIANDLGERLGIPSLALTIKRTKVGKYDKLK